MRRYCVLIFLCSVLIACGDRGNIATRAGTDALKDSVLVSIFLGYQLGQDFEQAISLSKQLELDNKIDKLVIGDDKITFATDVVLFREPNKRPVIVNCEIQAVNNMTASLMIGFGYLPSDKKVIDAYIHKYGDSYSVKKQKLEPIYTAKMIFNDWIWISSVR